MNILLTGGAGFIGSHTAVESAKPIPVGRFIPKEFSMAYME